MLAAIDIETTGLDPRVDSCVSIAIATTTESVVWENSEERVMLDDFATWLISGRQPGTFVTWNGCGFDWPFLSTRAAITGSGLANLISLTGSDLRTPKYGPLGGHDCGYAASVAGWDHVDAMLPWRPRANELGISSGLKPVARSQGIEVIEVDRTKISELTRAELMAYNISDVAATLELSEMLGDELDEWRDSLIIQAQAA